MDEKIATMTGEIIENRRVAPGHFQMTVRLPNSFPTPSPGQFVMVRKAEQDEPLLARPFSVYGFQRRGEQAAIELLYRITGRGTIPFFPDESGSKLSVLGPLGGVLAARRNREGDPRCGRRRRCPAGFLLRSGLLPPEYQTIDRTDLLSGRSHRGTLDRIGADERFM